MCTLTYQKLQIPAGRLGKANDYPLLFKPGAFEKGGKLDETEGLFLNYGKIMHTLPQQPNAKTIRKGMQNEN